jgi:hypothetical protein
LNDLKNLYFFFIAFLLFSCSQKESKNPYVDFFYPYDEEAKFYVYRDVIHGLNEKFYRVYGINDSYGKHIVVESYSNDGRILDALNYNYDSLSIIDQMVVDKDAKKIQAILLKNKMFPMHENDKTWFASKFPGIFDSTLFLSETKRSFSKSTPFKTRVLEESKNTIVFLDTVRLTLFNPFKKLEKEQKVIYKSYFAEGVGLVRFHDLQMKTDYKLEKILSQKEWLILMKR